MTLSRRREWLEIRTKIRSPIVGESNSWTRTRTRGKPAEGNCVFILPVQSVCVCVCVCVFAPPKRTNSFLPRTETRAPSRNESDFSQRSVALVFFPTFNGTVRARGVWGNTLGVGETGSWQRMAEKLRVHYRGVRDVEVVNRWTLNGEIGADLKQHYLQRPLNNIKLCLSRSSYRRRRSFSLCPSFCWKQRGGSRLERPRCPFYVAFAGCPLSEGISPHLPRLVTRRKRGPRPINPSPPLIALTRGK